ncbi:putative phosphoglycerate mutase [Nocardia tenerifensis]|uniref:Putative phosphoglycerate mutase n=1 Tax=Nocardia tenerifensis TaxID=228006 RepID=A0A318JT95_9NOCA|nr:histidine phosphatase family protein [Nocardia tenerifensis]PXX53963.1 putative phosphoglycerate mutase [Nocardia tenerifensis]
MSDQFERPQQQQGRRGLRVLLVRHGESVANVKDVVAGQRTCQGLSRLGHAQAQAVAEHLATEEAGRIVAVYSTPLRRAVQTAEPIARAYGLPVLRKLAAPYYGAAEGQPWMRVLASHDPPIALTPDRPIAPGAEPWSSWVARLGANFERITRSHHDGQTVVLVCHRESILGIEQYLYRALHSLAYVTAPAANCSITSWQRQRVGPKASRWERKGHNYIDHLASLSPMRAGSVRGSRS